MLDLRRREAPAGFRHVACNARASVGAKTSEERIVKVDFVFAGDESPNDAGLVACQQRWQRVLCLVRGDWIHSEQQRTHGGGGDDEGSNGCPPMWIGRVHKI